MNGSWWSVWDLQVQTILDDGYIELKNYYESLKESQPDNWERFVGMVGNEEDALLFDSKDYFHTGESSSKNRSEMYAKTLFSFVEVFNPNLGCIGFTDHNYFHDELMDALLKESNRRKCKAIAGVEVNVGGVHVLIFFNSPPYRAPTFSAGIKTFLGKLSIHSAKNGDGVLTVSPESLPTLHKIVDETGGVCIYAHCNSANGLFQERGKTDRTHLADVFNGRNPISLQTRNYENCSSLDGYITSNPALKSQHVWTIASDARSLKDIGASDKDENYCFIKGEPGFEGLRQSQFEPKTRILIGRDAPIAPIHRIESLTVDIPVEAQLGTDIFCFANKHDFVFSPNLTCVIGGRGTGKSMILNLLHEKLSPSMNPFFKNESVTNQGKPIDLSEAVAIDSDEEKKEVDYFGQSQIDSFAKDQKKLTSSLLPRIKGVDDGTIDEAEVQLVGEIATFDDSIDHHFELKRFLSGKHEKKREIQSLRKIEKSFTSDKYNELSEALAKTTEAASRIENAEKQTKDLQKDLEEIVPPLGGESETKLIDVEDSYQKAVNLVHDAINVLKEAMTDATNTELNQLKAKQKEARALLEQYLDEKGLTPQNQKDVATANEKAKELESDLETIDKGITRLTDQISKFDPPSTKEKKKLYEKALRDRIENLNISLKGLSEQVKEIELKYHFDMPRCKKEIYSDFMKRFNFSAKDIGTREDALIDALFPNDFQDGVSQPELLESIYPTGSKRPMNKAQEFLTKLLADKDNFELFLLIAKRHLYSSHLYNVIQVFYDKRALSESSFGQRCTAALVLLLKLGNRPIIIDEPEGHLDSLVIAEYLVDLIKDIKGQRQVIFATHNANVVVNGDSDLVIHLENDPHTRISKATSLTLENVEERHRILALEGGEEAFRKRDSKYLIT
jgi:DNA repair protein SbcC/Rad50